MSKNISMNQIAKESQVSCSAVSSFLANKVYKDGVGTIGISAKTEDKIIKACRKLKYQPKNLAIKLKVYPDFGCFGFLVNNAAKDGFSSFYSELMLGAYDEVLREEKNVNFAIGGFETGVDYLRKDTELPFYMTDGHTCKFLCAGLINYSFLLALQQQQGSIVYFLKEINLPGVTSIVPDYEEAGYLGIKALLENGHTKIAVAAENYFLNLEYSTQKLTDGIKKAFSEYNIIFNNSEIIYNTHTDTNKSNCFEQIRDKQLDSTAIFCFCDYTASKIMKSINDAGLNIPNDISIVGCNNQFFSQNLNPSLTSIDLNLRGMGKKGAEILNGKYSKPKSLYKFPVKLILRNSVKNINNIQTMEVE